MANSLNYPELRKSGDNGSMATTTAFEYHTEIIDGVEVEKYMPKKLHALVQTYLLVLLSKLLERQGHQVLPELGVLVGPGKDRVVPDLVVFAEDTEFVDGYVASPLPALVIEILSPGQPLSSVLRPVERLCAADQTMTSTAWILNPAARRAWIYSYDGGLTEVTNNLLEERMIGLEIKLDDIWKALED